MPVGNDGSESIRTSATARSTIGYLATYMQKQKTIPKYSLTYPFLASIPYAPLPEAYIAASYQMLVVVVRCLLPGS